MHKFFLCFKKGVVYFVLTALFGLDRNKRQKGWHFKYLKLEEAKKSLYWMEMDILPVPCNSDRLFVSLLLQKKCIN